LAGVAQQFLKNIYTHGIKQACEKFSKNIIRLKNSVRIMNIQQNKTTAGISWIRGVFYK
jgi:hypothetical protein